MVPYSSHPLSLTGFKPNDMDKEKEVAYIVRMIHKQNSIEKQPGYKLEQGDYVRLIKPIQLMTKKRRKLTKRYYVVESTDLNRVVVMAADGSTQSVSRSDCVKINKDTGLTQASSIKDGGRGVLKRIVGYNDKKKTYRVEFEMPVTGKPYLDNIPVRNIRAQFPTRMGDIEREFFAREK